MNLRMGKQKRKWFLCCFILVFLMIALIGIKNAVASEYVNTPPPVTMEVTYGYDNSAKGGRFIPVYITCTNSGDQIFDGEVRFLSIESDQSLYRYDYPITINPEDQYEKHVDLPLGIYNDQIFVSIVDNNKEIILKKRLKLNINQDFAELFVGVLSDSADQLQYLNRVGINYSLLKTKVFNLDEKTFPQDEIGLNLLDVILVSDYDMGQLSELQLQALNDWVEHGGLLLLGTGERVADVLTPFGEELLDGTYSPPRKTVVNMGVEYAVSDPGDSQIQLSCVDLLLENGKIIFSDDQLSLISMVTKGKGAVAVAAFDFKELKEFAVENPSYVDKLFTNLLGDGKIARLSEGVYQGDSDQYWAVKNMLNIGDSDRLPNLVLYVTVIIIYLLIIGPCLYFFLRRKQMGKYYHVTVAGISFLFTGVIYMMGSSTRFNSTFFTYATFRDASGDSVNETTYVNIRNPDNKSYQVIMDPSYILKPVTQVYYPEHSGFSGIEQPDIIMKYKDDKIVLLADHVKAFEPVYVQLEKSEKNEHQEGFVTDLIWYDNKISGTIQNNFEDTVENITLFMQGQILEIGTLKAGEVKQVNHAEPIFIPMKSWDEVAEVIAKNGETENHKVQTMDVWKKTNMISFYMEYYLTANALDMKVIGTSVSTAEQAFLSSGRNEIDGLTLVSSTLEIDTSKDNRIYRSGMERRPKVISGQYDPYSNTMSLGDTVVLEYALGNDLAVEKISFHSISDTFSSNGYDYLNVFSGNMYFYNYDTGNYEMMNRDQTEFEKEQLKPYLSPSNTLLVKYVCDNTMTSNWNTALPMVMMLGRKE